MTLEEADPAAEDTKDPEDAKDGKDSDSRRTWPERLLTPARGLWSAWKYTAGAWTNRSWPRAY